jgi:hypothetical protein
VLDAKEANPDGFFTIFHVFSAFYWSILGF